MADNIGWLFMGGICVGPILIFALGFALGAGVLPFRLRIERTEKTVTDGKKMGFEVDA
jgi:hypothetical protein